MKHILDLAMKHILVVIALITALVFFAIGFILDSKGFIIFDSKGFIVFDSKRAFIAGAVSLIMLVEYIIIVKVMDVYEKWYEKWKEDAEREDTEREDAEREDTERI